MQSRNLQNGFFLILLALVSLIFLYVIRDFMKALLWAAVFATLFFPIHEHLEKQFRGRASLAAALTVVLILFIAIIPLFLIGVAVTREAAMLYERLSSGDIDVRGAMRWGESMLPRLMTWIEGLGFDPDKIKDGAANAALNVSQYLGSQALNIGQNALQFTVMLALMLYVLFFFLREGRALLDGIVRALPLGDVRERKLIAKVAEVSRATVKGTLLVGMTQGAMGGILFWAVGIRAPVLWGVVMTVLALLPAVGTALVWAPAGIILLAMGEITRGIIVLAVGSFIIGLVDNIMRPQLVGRDTKMPDYLILLSTLGGLATFGLSGFVIGPLSAALFLSVWKMFEEEYGEEMEQDAMGQDAPPSGATPKNAAAENAASKPS